MSDESVVTMRTYAILLAGSLTYTLMQFAWFSLPAYLSVIIDGFGLSGTQAGLLAGAIPLTYIPVALFSGLIVDRFGPLRSLSGGAAIVGIAQVGQSASTNFLSMLGFTLLLGLGATGITFGLPKLVSDMFPSGGTGFPSSIYLLGASAGTAGAFAIGRPILGPALGGWRPLFYHTGLVTAAYAVVLAVLAWKITVASDSDRSSALTVASVRRELAVVVRHRDLLLVVGVGTMYLLVFHGMQGWLPTILEARGSTPKRAGRVTSLLTVANAVGILLIPAVTDRLGIRREGVIVCGGIVAVGVFTVIYGGISVVATLGIVVTGFGVGGLSPLVRIIPPELDGIGSARTGTAVGLVFAVGEMGGFLGPVLIGTLSDVTASYAPGLALLACGGVVVILAGRALPSLES